MDKTLSGLECLFQKGGEPMEDKKQKDKPFFEKHEKSIGITLIIILIGIVLYINSEPAIGTDTNTTTNNTITQTDEQFLKQIADENWCMNQYLHRRPILYINAKNNETGTTTTMRLQQAIDQNLMKGKGEEIYMENLKKTGLLCGNYLYFDWRNLYNICLQLPDLNKEECFKTDAKGMEKWVKYINDNNLSGDTNA